MKKILHLLASNKYSGAENVVCEIISQTSDFLDSVYCSPDGPIRDSLNKKNIRYYSISKLTPKNLNHILHTYQPDVIHAHDFKASICAALSNFQGTIISHIHQNPKWFHHYNFKSIIYSLTSIRYKDIVLVSNEILQHSILNKRKVTVIENYVNENLILEKFKEKEIQNVDFVYCGRLCTEKNPIEFIRFIKKLHEKKYFVSAYMIGDGNLKEECLNNIEKLGLKEHIQMLGFQENPYPYMASTKFLVVPSLVEGFGLVAVESMILGVPVISYNAGGLKSIVNDKNGIVCNSTDEAIQKMMKIWNNDTEYLEKQKICRSSVRQFTDKQTWIEKIKKLYSGR